MATAGRSVASASSASRLRNVVSGLALCTLAALAGGARAQVCAAPGSAGTAAISGVVNTYWTPAEGTYTGSGSIALSGQRGASASLAEGDLVLVIQMQCANISVADSTAYGDGAAGEPAAGYSVPNSGCVAGGYEFVRAAAGSSSALLVLAGSPLLASYQQAPATNATGRRTFQVIRVPQYLSASLAGTVGAAPWNGDSGGVVVIDVADDFDFAGASINVDGAGFRGGGGRARDANDAVERFRWDDDTRHAVKGEGIAGTPRFVSDKRTPGDGLAGTVIDLGPGWGGYPTGSARTGDFARGAPGNAGGGGAYWDVASDNGGGGGGGNGRAGGQGAAGWRNAGYAGVLADYSNIPDRKWGFGGAEFAQHGVAYLVLGGGGGGGDNNNNSLPAQSSGAAGGGIVMLRAGSITGSGAIQARGARATDNPLNDGAGGGGAGGSVLAVATTWSGAVAIDVSGGRGGDAWLTGTGAHGSGGGGAGGVAVTSALVAAAVAGGAPGMTTTADAPPGGATHGAQAGGDGRTLVIDPASDTPGTRVGRTCKADLQVTKTNTPDSGPSDLPDDAVVSGAPVSYSIVVSNAGPLAADAAVLTDPASPGLTCTTVTCTVTAGAATCPASPTVAALQSPAGLELPNLPVNGALTFTLGCTVD